MPIYVYECEHCTKRKELIKSFRNIEEIELCENCTIPDKESLDFPQKMVRPRLNRVSFPGGHAVHFGKGFFKTGGY